MKIIKLFFLTLSIPLSIASYQAQASHYVYNSQNQMVLIDNHKLEYAPSGKLSQADTLKFIGRSQVQGNIAEARFGGVTLRSDGTYSTTFTDGHNTPKTSNDRVYSSPYGKHKPIKLDIHNNIQVFGDAYSLFGAEYMGARWYFPQFYRFGQQDTMDVSNRFNLDNDNPIMNYDPTGHMSMATKQILIFSSMVVASLLFYGSSLLLVPEISEGFASALDGNASLFNSVDSKIGEETSFNSLLDSTVNKIRRYTKYKKTATLSGYLVSDIAPAAITSIQKIKNHATPGNIAFSLIIPILVGSLDSTAMIIGMDKEREKESIFYLALSGGINGVASPFIQQKNMQINANTSIDMINGFIAGIFKGVVGAQYSRVANADGNYKYGTTINMFLRRGITMELGGEGIKGLIETTNNHNYVANAAKLTGKIFMNTSLQVLGGLIMKKFKYGASVPTYFKATFINNAGFNTGTNIINYGSSLVNSLFK